MGQVKHELAKPENETQIRQLLAASDLHHEDILPAQLRHFLLGWDGSRLVAVVGLEIKDHVALLRSLAVDSDYRNRKIASGLVDAMEAYAKSLKVSTLYLLTMTAEAFFKKHGYRQTARDSAPSEIQQTTEFQSLCPASAVCMAKHLDDC